MKEQLMRLVAATLLAIAPAMGGAASFQGLSYATDGEVVAGRWTALFSKAKTKAKADHAPLVAVWVRPTCGYCKKLGSALAQASVSKWAAKRGYYFVIGVEEMTAEASSVKSFVRNSSGEFPYVGIWWPKQSGGEVKQLFSGRSGTMPVSSGSLEQQFMDSVDKYVGDYAGLAPKYCDVTFNANGGSISTADKTRSVVTGKAVGKLPAATRSGYELVGWFTAKTGGEKISSSTVVTKTATYYAQWAKVYALTAAASPAAGGKVSPATGSFATGEGFSVTATAKSGYVLEGWYSGTKRLSQEKTYKDKMGSANLSLTAKFIKKADDWVKIGAFKTAAEYETKKEIVPITLSATGGSLPTLSVSKLPSGLKFTAKAITGHAANTIYGTPTKSGIYSALVSAKTAGGAKASVGLPLVVRKAGERIVRVSCDTAMGKVSGGGVFADGKKATVKASAASKHCFAGWTIGGELVSRSTSYSYPVDGKDVTLTANFVTKEADLKSVSLAVAGKTQIAAVVQTNVVRCGVQLRLPVIASAKSGISVTTSGLPSGLKLVKTLVNKELKEYSYEIAGTPSSASKVNSKTGLVKPTVAKIKVTTLGKSTVTYQYAFVIEALPTWAYGNFSGFATADEEGAGVGAATLTVSSAGKISGKFALLGTKWTYSVTGYARAEYVADARASRFFVEATAKNGKLTRPVSLVFSAGGVAADGTDFLLASEAVGALGDGLLMVRRNFWKDKFAHPALATGSYASPAQPAVKARVSANGNVKFSGRLADGTKVSSSATAFFDGAAGYAAGLLVPATKTYGGFYEDIGLMTE